jgi:hypothetical protein
MWHRLRRVRISFNQDACSNVQTLIKRSLVLICTFRENTAVVMSWDSSVGIATGYGLGDGGVGVRVLVGQELSSLHVVQTGSGTHPAKVSKKVKLPL